MNTDTAQVTRSARLTTETTEVSFVQGLDDRTYRFEQTVEVWDHRTFAYVAVIVAAGSRGVGDSTVFCTSLPRTSDKAIVGTVVQQLRIGSL